MKHTTAELIKTVYTYFPQGLQEAEPRYKETPEYVRRMEARIPASARFRDWCRMLTRIRERFPDALRDIEIQNFSPFLASPTVAGLDRCYTGGLSLPSRTPEETNHQLEFLVSFVVPYYILRSSHLVDEPETPELPPGLRPRTIFIGDTCYALPPDPNAVDDEPRQKRRLKRQVDSFTLSPDEEPFANAISEEIETTFPGYEPIPPEVGLTVIPDVQAGGKWFGEATIFTCLFSDNW